MPAPEIRNHLKTELLSGIQMESEHQSGIRVTDGMFCMKGTTSVPKSVLRYTVDKVRQVFETEVCYSNVSFV